ncbi:DUF2236 domain-containing protein [Marivirga sp. S37H4]|uniref:DUF2236 domain-containing protein n=1 Tax=Marivirga aurantiaca TaxID=2802615 RepID=A0A934X0R0_9BACT|nr:oxygenase MpaB family protein [Marivirga aurantiaca]MBK6266372.1 DUF2236 domain-containing protein [Marivirga aurantiaca]
MENKTIQYSKAELDNAKQSGDLLADKTVTALFKEGFHPHQSVAYNALQFNHQPIPEEFPQVLIDYFQEIKAYQPDAKVIKNGSLFFQEYTTEIMLCLGLLSLPYCYAAADGAKVLSFSRRIIENPEQRLRETGEFVFDVCEPEAFKAEGKGYISIAKVRLMHAAIRYHLQHSDKWNMEWGMPVNQEDMAGTNLSFSLINIRGLRKLGFTISPEKAEVFIKYWNEIGVLLGLSENLLPADNQSAFILEKKLTERNFRPSEEGKVLAKSLQDYINSQGLPLKFSADALMQYLLGEELSEMIGVKSKSDQKFVLGNLKNLNAFRSLFPRDKQKAFKEARKQFQLQKLSGEKSGNPFQFLTALHD